MSCIEAPTENSAARQRLRMEFYFVFAKQVITKTQPEIYGLARPVAPFIHISIEIAYSHVSHIGYIVQV
jgi:hypothetical protein